MSEAPQIEKVHYDTSSPIMDRELIDMLLLCDEDEPDLDLANELFELFETESASKLDSLEEVCASGDVMELKKIVHFVAGSAGNLGMSRLNAFYRAIEAAIEAEELVDISDCETPIRQAFDQARMSFRADFNL